MNQKENREMSNYTRPVLVTTEHRGVFFGRTTKSASPKNDSIKLQGAKMAIYWGTTKGVSELAHTGPTSKSRISAPADVELVDITAVFEVTDDAVAAWDAA